MITQQELIKKLMQNAKRLNYTPTETGIYLRGAIDAQLIRDKKNN